MIRLRENTDLREMTTFGLPAMCGRLVEFSDPVNDLPELDRRGLLDRAVLLGGGSNMLFTAPAPALTVIHPANDSITVDKTPDGQAIVTADAAVVLDGLCHTASQLGLWGLENLSGIPGHIGGAAVQNVGAYGVELADLVDSVTCYSRKNHRFVTYSKEDCQYGYRDSIFKHQEPDELLVVCRVTLRLQATPRLRLGYKGLYDTLCERYSLDRGNPQQYNITELLKAGISPLSVRESVMSLRDSKLPAPSETGSAGSFFKNPVVAAETLEAIISRWK